MSVTPTNNTCPCKSPHIDLASFDETVEVVVGEEARSFVLHKPLLISVSRFFKRTFEGGFKEATENKLTLPEEQIDIFQRFQLWLYTGSPLAKEEFPSEVPWGILLSLYIFAECYDIPHLCNATMDALNGKLQASKELPVGDLHEVYANTRLASPLRKFFVETFARKVKPLIQDVNFTKSPEDTYPFQFLIDLVFEYEHLKGRPHSILDVEDLVCRYHVHPSVD